MLRQVGAADFRIGNESGEVVAWIGAPVAVIFPK
jgi:hypothetical protein